MIAIKEAIIVEGKYDKNALAQLVDTVILTTDGFGFFNDTEKRDLITRLAKTRGVIILTDSDGAGFLIRNRLKGMLPPENVKHAYIPDVYGKERRKRERSCEGMLGVEGMPPEILEKCLLDAGATRDAVGGGVGLTKADLYELGLSGGTGANVKRERLLLALGLPKRLSPNAMLPVVNSLYSREELLRVIETIRNTK